MATVAYLSMETALENRMPTRAGGLGVLAGDTLRSTADLGIPMVAVSLLYRRGHFRQSLNARGNQTEEPVGGPEEHFVAEQGDARPDRDASDAASL